MAFLFTAEMLDHILLPFSNNTKCACSQHECDTSDQKMGFIMAVALVKKLKGSSGYVLYILC